MNDLEIYIVVFLLAMGSIYFWLYKFYMRCNLLEERSIIIVFSLLVLLMYYLSFVSLNWHRKNFVILVESKKNFAQKLYGCRGAQSFSRVLT